MKPYKITLLTFAATLGIVFVILLLILNSDEMPGPRVSGSPAFNEQALLLRKAIQKGKPVDILIVGSSMGLGNLNGSELAKVTGTRAILNGSSWSLSVAQTWHLTRILLDQIHPKVVIYPVYHGDFQKHEGIDPDWKGFKECLSAKTVIPLYLENFDFLYYWERYKEQHPKRPRRRFSLNFDEFGGVPALSDHFSDDKRVLDESIWDPEDMIALEEMSSYLNQKGIAFLVVVCPMQHDVERRFSPKLEIDLWPKVSEVLKKSNGLFVHVKGDGNFDDSLFVDFAHMDENGSKKMADVLAPVLKQIPLSNAR